MQLSQGAEQDMEAVVALWARCGLTRPWNDPRHDFLRATGVPNACVIIGTADNALVGTVMVGHDGHRGWVYYLAVVPELQRRGHGRALMAAAERWLRDREVPKIQLMVRETNAAAIGFYERLGLERQPVVTLGRRLDDSQATSSTGRPPG
jgi:ribosomal protein S18 acetylase RimI-like enzyme